MLAARLVGRGGLSLAPALKCSLTRAGPLKPNCHLNTIKRHFADDVRPKSYARRRTLKEIASAPTQGMPFQIGAAAVAGSAAFGLGALCYYGLGLSNNKAGIVEQSMIWPQYVRDRVKDTYLYVTGSLLITAGSALAVFRSPMAIRLVSKNSLMAVFASLAAMIATGSVCRSIPYEPGLGSKQLSWILHTSVVGAVLAPICFLGGPVLVRALWYTAGVVGGLSTIAVCAPSDKFLNMGAPLGMGLGAVLAASIGTYWLPPNTMVGAGLYSVAMYGGLLLFSAFLLYDTQRVVRAAETYPQYAPRPFDPVNSAISVYMDIINIFIRIATMLASGGGNRRN